VYKNQIKIFLSCCLLSLSLGQVDYNSEIQPIFNSSCTSCHQDGGADQNGLDLTSYDNLMAGDSNNGPVIIPGDHISSPLWQKVNSGAMPPGNDPDLNSDEIDLIAAWIDEGAFEEPAGCTDPEAYNCADDDIWSTYIFDVGIIMYDNSCNWDWNTSTSQPDDVGGCEYHPDELPDGFVNPDHCQGYYNPGASNDDGSCRYYQAPHEEDVLFEVEEIGISLDWSAFNPPNSAILESYHIQRCIVTNCTWVAGYTPGDSNTETNTFEEFDWVPDVEIKYAIAVKYSNNPYWGWAIGASYITPEESCSELGDLNGDDTYNVLDIVNLANCVLAQNCNCIPNGCAGDLNEDLVYNVLDIVTLANCVLAQNCGGRVDDATESSLIMKDNMVSIEADGFIGGVQMTLTHGEGFFIKMTDRALFADYLTNGNETRLLVITPETDELFSFSGDFEITEVIVANSQYEVPTSLPVLYRLSAAYPNPFNPVTTMNFTLPDAGNVNVQVYNLQGQIVSTLLSGYQAADTYTLIWEAYQVPSGMYFVKAEAEGFTETQKLMLIK